MRALPIAATAAAAVIAWTGSAHARNSECVWKALPESTRLVFNVDVLPDGAFLEPATAFALRAAVDRCGLPSTSLRAAAQGAVAYGREQRHRAEFEALAGTSEPLEKVWSELPPNRRLAMAPDPTDEAARRRAKVVLHSAVLSMASGDSRRTLPTMLYLIARARRERADAEIAAVGYPPS